MILHIDLDYFFAQVEELECPSLKGTPFAVGGTMRRGVICTCNYIARSYGVRAGMPGFKALEICPSLKMLPVIMEKYVTASKKVFDVIYSFSDIVEQVSIDEAYIKINGKNDDESIIFSKNLQRAVYKETGLTSSIGLSKNKLLSKIIGSINKPNGFYFLADREIENFIKRIRVKELPGVGNVILQQMKTLGIEYCEDLQKISIDELFRIFGKLGRNLYFFCRGEDYRTISQKRVEKSISVESTTEVDLISLDECLSQLEILYSKLILRIDDLAKDRIAGIFLKITDTNFSHYSTSRTCSYHSLDCFKIFFKKFYEIKGRPKLRLIGIGVNLGSDMAKQLSISFDNTPKFFTHI